jgi:hypothetical protein
MKIIPCFPLKTVSGAIGERNPPRGSEQTATIMIHDQIFVAEQDTERLVHVGILSVSEELRRENWGASDLAVLRQTGLRPITPGEGVIPTHRFAVSLRNRP